MHLAWLLVGLVLGVACDDAEYQFRYRVTDQETGQDFGQEELKQGDDLGGEYQVLLPDGRTQIVTYTASDPSGFIANVEYQGEVTIQDSPVQSLRVAKKLRPAVESINLAGRSPVVRVQPAPRVAPQIIPVPRVAPKIIPAPRVAPKIIPAPRVAPKIIPVPRVAPKIIPAPRVAQKIIPAQRLAPKIPAPTFVPLVKSRPPATRIVPGIPKAPRIATRVVAAPRVNPLSGRTKKVTLNTPTKAKVTQSVIRPGTVKTAPLKLKSKIPSRPKQNVRKLALPKVNKKVVPKTVTPKPIATRKPSARQYNKGLKTIKDIPRKSKSKKTDKTQLPAVVMPKKSPTVKNIKKVVPRSTTPIPQKKSEKTTESPEYKPSSKPPKMKYKDSDHIASASKVLNSLFREDIREMKKTANDESEES